MSAELQAWLVLLGSIATIINAAMVIYLSNELRKRK